ncbi:hypothetical protein B0H19DRAFT_1162493 [Mycena capillaripes]|nr:hypothetical protein B0H19DRAFT_1162493 [Mycena capillaripes]
MRQGRKAPEPVRFGKPARCPCMDILENIMINTIERIWAWLTDVGPYIRTAARENVREKGQSGGRKYCLRCPAPSPSLAEFEGRVAFLDVSPAQIVVRFAQDSESTRSSPDTIQWRINWCRQLQRWAREAGREMAAILRAFDG